MSLSFDTLLEAPCVSECLKVFYEVVSWTLLAQQGQVLCVSIFGENAADMDGKRFGNEGQIRESLLTMHGPVKTSYCAT